MSSTAQNLASSRIAALLDENSFVEIGAAVTARATDFNMNNTDTPSDGVITGYGVINDSLVYVYSQDASVLGGSMGETGTGIRCGSSDYSCIRQLRRRNGSSICDV